MYNWILLNLVNKNHYLNIGGAVNTESFLHDEHSYSREKVRERTYIITVYRTTIAEERLDISTIDSPACLTLAD
jgi:hypothetical protein